MADGSVSDSHGWRREGVVGDGDGDGSGRRSGRGGGPGKALALSLPISYKLLMFLGFYAVLHVWGLC